jgi:hypothetical protein
LIVFQLLSSQFKHARKAHQQLVLAFHKNLNPLSTAATANFTFHKKASFPVAKLYPQISISMKLTILQAETAESNLMATDWQRKKGRRFL